MSYTAPAALALAFTPWPRPARPLALPTASALNFLLGGMVPPPAAPAIRTRAWAHWQPASKQTRLAVGQFALCAEVDHLTLTGLTLASHHWLAGSTGWAAAASADLHQAERLRQASPLAALIQRSGWAVCLTADFTRLAGWGTAARVKARHQAQPMGILSQVDRHQAEHGLGVDTRHRPFDPRYDLVPPLIRNPVASGLSFALADGYNLPSDPLALAFAVARDHAIRPLYPRSAGPRAAGMGVADEADQTGTVRWGAGTPIAKPGDEGNDDDSGGEIGERDDPIQPLPAPWRIMNSIACYALVTTGGEEERIPIAPTISGLKLLIDGYAWELTGELAGRTSANYVKPASDGTPAHIELTVNGWTWLLAVKKYSVSRANGDERYSFTAVSRTAFLSGDWASKVTTVADGSGAWQLVEAHLAALGFTLARPDVGEWIQTPDWTLTSGSVSWVASTPLEVLSDVAKACGAVLVPSLSEDVISVYPRYRVSPSRWPTMVASAYSHVIAEGMIKDEGWEPQVGTRADRVLIGGTNYGVITEVIRAGSDGVESLDDISDNLAQDEAANLERGRNLLSETGASAVVTISVPLMPPGQSPGLLVPGDLIRIDREDASVVRALVIGNAISMASISEVMQSVSLEVHEPEDA